MGSVRIVRYCQNPTMGGGGVIWVNITHQLFVDVINCLDH
jgi:hypothetical protein